MSRDLSLSVGALPAATFQNSVDPEREVCQQSENIDAAAAYFLSPARETPSAPPLRYNYAARLFDSERSASTTSWVSYGNDGASGAGPGFAEEQYDQGEADSGLGRGILEFLVALIPFFSLSGCGSEESVNPAPTVPCTPKEELDGGVLPDGGGGAGGGEAWICPDYPDDYYYNPDENGEPSPDPGY